MKKCTSKQIKLRLTLNQEIKVSVLAKQPYSDTYIEVKEGEEYQFSVAPNDKWTDFVIKKNANGFNNIFIAKRNLRLPAAKCFMLCGTIDKNEENHFPIGISLLDFTIPKSGELYFFANDSKKKNKEGEFKWYNNNKGCIILTMKRVK